MRVISSRKPTVPFSCCGTVEPVLEDHPIDHKNVAFQDRWDRFTYIEAYINLLPKLSGLSSRVVAHGSGLSRQVHCMFVARAATCLYQVQRVYEVDHSSS